jgi:dUTP pyrophosphatase
MKVKIKKLTQKAIVPEYAKAGDAGLDLVATSINETEMYVEYGTGLAFELPEGYVGLIFPRSSLSNYHLSLSNSVGVVDSGYRGEVKFRFKKTDDHWSAKYYKVGDKIGQLIVMPFPKVELIEVEELSSSERGEGGYGSSGK